MKTRQEYEKTSGVKRKKIHEDSGVSSPCESNHSDREYQRQLIEMVIYQGSHGYVVIHPDNTTYYDSQLN